MKRLLVAFIFALLFVGCQTTKDTIIEEDYIAISTKIKVEKFDMLYKEYKLDKIIKVEDGWWYFSFKKD